MSRRAAARLLAAGLLAQGALFTAGARADAGSVPGLAARGDAFTAPAGRYSFGIWNPLRYALSDRVELAAHPLVFFAAPHLEVRVQHADVRAWRLTGEYALSLPSPAMRLLQGHLFPSWERGGGQIGWAIVPRVGLLASRGAPERGILTLRIDYARGVALAATDARPLETLAPLDLLFQPVLAGYRARAGALFDRAVGTMRWRASADVYLHGVDEDHPSGPLGHVTFRAGAGMDIALGPRTRLVLGVYAWNDFQHEVDGRGRSVRSNLFLPVLDVIWSGGG